MGDILFGKKDEQTFRRSPFAGATEQAAQQAQQAQLSALEGFRPEDPGTIRGRFARADEAELAQRRTGLQDVQRDIQGAQAARGLGSTSVGAGQLVSGRKALTEREAQLKSSIQDRVNALRQQQRQAFFSAATGVASSNRVPIRFQDQTVRANTPGIAGPLIGAGLGAFAGGAGSAIGAQIGKGLFSPKPNVGADINGPGSLG